MIISRPIEILLTEDNPADIRLVQVFFQDKDMPAHNLHTVNDGVHALRFLRQEENYRNLPRPDIILLDVNMPRMDGIQLLEIIKNDPSLCKIPVCMMICSASEREKLQIEKFEKTY